MVDSISNGKAFGIPRKVGWKVYFLLESYFISLRTSEIHLFYNLQLFYWHFLEILWLFIFLVFYDITINQISQGMSLSLNPMPVVLELGIACLLSRVLSWLTKKLLTWPTTASFSWASLFLGIRTARLVNGWWIMGKNLLLVIQHVSLNGVSKSHSAVCLERLDM